MCGIVGIAASGKRQHFMQRKDFFEQALYTDAVRGFHSTGVFMVPYDKESIYSYKRAMQASDFLDMRTTNSLLTKIDDSVYAVGHNRHATKGGISHSMAHPFTHGAVTLVHNGTLTTHAHLPEGNKFTSDSECITHAFNAASPEEIIPELRGAFALVWYDHRDKKLHLTRNKERPLSFAFDEKTDTMLIASESKMLEWLAARNNYNIGKVYDLNPGYEIMLGDKDFRNYEHRKHKLHVPQVFNNYGGGHHGYNNYSGNGYNGYSSAKGGASGTAGFQGTSAKSSGGSKPVVRGDKALAEKFGLLDTQRVDVLVERFVNYPGQKGQHGAEIYGFLEGKLYGDDNEHIVSCQGVAKSQWEWAVGQYLEMDVKAIRELSGVVTIMACNPEYSDLNHKGAGDKDSDTTAMVYGPNMQYITVEEFDKLTNKGCANCGANIHSDEHMEIGWTDDRQPICPTCVAVTEDAFNA